MNRSYARRRGGPSAGGDFGGDVQSETPRPEKDPLYNEMSRVLPVNMNPVIYSLTWRKNPRIAFGEVDLPYMGELKQDLEERGTKLLEEYENARDIVEKSNNAFTNAEILAIVPQGMLRDMRRKGMEDDEIVLDFLTKRAEMRADFERKRGVLTPGTLPYDNMRPYVDEVDRLKKTILVKNIDVAERLAQSGFKTSSRNLSRTLLKHVQEMGIDPRYHIRLFMNRVDCDLAHGNMSPEVETDLLMVLDEFNRYMKPGGTFDKQFSSTVQIAAKNVMAHDLRLLQIKMFTKLVEMYAIQGRFVTALEKLETIIANGAWYAPLAQAYRALIFASLGQHEEAVLTLEEAQQALPKHRTLFQRDFRLVEVAVGCITKTKDVKDHLKYFMSKIKDRNRSIVVNALASGVERDRTELRTYANIISQLLFQQKKYREAAEYNSLALLSSSNDGNLTEDIPLLLAQRGQILAAMGDRATAARLFQTAANLSKLHIPDGLSTDMFSILSTQLASGTAPDAQSIKTEVDKLSARLGLLNVKKPSVVETFIALSYNPREHVDESSKNKESSAQKSEAEEESSEEKAE